MPAFHGAGIRVRLGTLPLADSITPKVVLRKGDVAARQCDEAEQALRKSKFLDEERVQFPGDEENFGLNWLGKVPFLQVQAGWDAFEPDKDEKGSGSGGYKSSLDSKRSSVARNESSTPFEGHHSLSVSTESERKSSTEGKDANAKPSSEGRRLSGPSTRAHPQPLPSAINPTWLHKTAPVHSSNDSNPAPKALVLHVMLTAKTFYENLSTGSPLHLKVDVLFNGRLSNCVLVHQGDIRAGAKSMHQIFGGSRVDYMIERPWVILPPKQNVDLNLEGNPKPVNPQQRWRQICAALMTEANDRGADANGDSPPSAGYLRDLASMQMPDGVKELQKPGSRAFGVVDVVVSVGIGRKITNGVAYLKEPMRLVDERYSYVSETKVEKIPRRERLRQEQANPTEGSGEGGEEGTVGVGQQEKAQVDHDAEGDSDPEYETASSTVPASTLAGNSSANVQLPPAFCNPFTGAQIPSIQHTHTSAFSTSPAPITFQNADSGLSFDQNSGMQFRKRGFSEFVESTSSLTPSDDERMRSRNTRKSFPSAHTPMSSSMSSYSLGTQSLNFNFNNYHGNGHVNPYQLPYQGMMAGLDLLNMPSPGSFDGPASSPLHYENSGQLTLPSVISSAEVPTRNTGGMGTPFGSSPSLSSSLPPSQTHRMLFGQTNASTYDVGGSPNGISPAPSGAGPGALTQTPSDHHGLPVPHPAFEFHGLPSSSYEDSFNHPLNRPLAPPGRPPPVGLFPATTKPKTVLPKNYGLIEPKLVNAGLIDPNQPRSSFLMRRLVIRGKGGIRIVDHAWQTPQRISVKHAFPEQDQWQAECIAPPKCRRESPGSAEYTDPSASLRRGSRKLNVIATPPPTSPTKLVDPAATLSTSKSKRDSVHDGHAASEPKGYPTTVEPPVHTQIDQEADTARSSVVDSQSLRSLPSAGTTSRRGGLGVQGPKAAKFVFDNPEELLRKPKAKSTSQPATSSKADVPMADVPAGPGREMRVRKDSNVVGSSFLESNTSSSPLSSLPSSPETGRPEKKQKVEEVAMLSLQPAAVLNTTESSQAPPPQPPPPNEVMPLPKPLPSSNVAVKKKHSPIKRHSGPRVRQPRSPNRLSATGNPPLNENCVIQYATSEGQGGALRQVKSERQGVFAEESVVVGMRFFIAG